MLVKSIRKSRGRLGVAAAEFAVILPVFAILLVGMLEMGRIIMFKQMMTDAARKSCRTGIQRDKGNSDITTDAKDITETDNKVPTGKTNVTITVTSPTGTTLSDALGAPAGSKV